MNLKEIKKYFTKENIKFFFKNIWGKEPEPVDESVWDDPDRYVRFDVWKDNQYWEDKKRYKREKTILKIRRFTIVFLFIFFFAGFIKSANFIIKRNEFLSCMGRDVCIYLGPKMNDPVFSNVHIGSLKNGDLLSVSYEKGDYYDIKKNRFVKINNLRHQLPNYKEAVILNVSCGKRNLIENSNGNILIIDKQFPLEIFDVQSKKFIATNVNLFNGLPHIIPKTAATNEYFKNKTCIAIGSSKYEYLVPYINNYSLIMTSINNPLNYNYIYGFKTKLTTPEKLYLFNNDDFSLTAMPPFVLPLRYFPRPSDIIVLSNGKIIMPIRYKYIAPDDDAIRLNNSKAKTDHIEIYDPVQKKFIAETNKDILEDNILHMVLPNNNVIFLNKNSTYIFFNETNKFLKADEELTKRNQKAVEKLAKLMFEHMGLDIEEIFGVDRARVIKLAPQKFLITCEHGHTVPFGTRGNINTSLYSLIKMDLNEQEKIRACRNTVFYDYEKNIVKKGPKFLKPHFYAEIEQLTHNLFIVVGGIDRIYQYKSIPYLGEYVQFIKIKN